MEMTESKSNVNEQQILIERNGKFLLVHLKDLTATEKEIYDPAYSAETAAKQSRHRAISSAQGKPKKNDREIKRARSAAAVERPASKDGELRKKRLSSDSTFKYSSDEKQHLAAKQREKERLQLEEDKQKEEENQRKAADRNAAFEDWLRKKKQEDQRSCKSRCDSDSVDKNESEDHSAFEDWLRLKREQRKEERRANKERLAYLHENKSFHSKQDCDQAYSASTRVLKELLSIGAGGQLEESQFAHIAALGFHNDLQELKISGSYTYIWLEQKRREQRQQREMETILLKQLRRARVSSAKR